MKPLLSQFLFVLACCGIARVQGAILAPAFDPLYVNDMGLCGVNTPIVSRAVSDGSWLDGFINGYYEGLSVWKSFVTTGTAWVSVHNGQSTRWSGGVVLAYERPDKLKNFEVWIGDDTNVPGTNKLCYKSTTKIISSSFIMGIIEYFYLVKRNLILEK